MESQTCQTVLLTRIADELAFLRETSIVVQDAASALSEAAWGTGAAMREMQKLDFMTQAIDDLERVTRYIAENPRAEFSNSTIASLIRLGVVEGRLLAAPENQVGESVSNGDVALF